MNQKITLLPVDATNAAHVSLLVKVIQDNYQHTAILFTEAKARDPHLNFYFAYLGEELIGVSGLDFKTPFLAETIKTVILTEHRGKNLGKLLSQAIEDQCRSRGVKKVMTTIYADNHAMISIKLRQGYTIEGYHPDHEAPGFHEYSLGKILH